MKAVDDNSTDMGLDNALIQEQVEVLKDTLIDFDAFSNCLRNGVEAPGASVATI